MDAIVSDLVFTLTDSTDSFQIVVSNPDAKHVAVIAENENIPDYLTQMAAIFKSIHIDLHTQVQVVALAKKEHCARIKEFCPQGEYFFLFGMAPMDVGVTLPCRLYSIIRLGSSYILSTESFAVLHYNVESKKKLWSCLKTNFLAD